jgi:hypothetical protein
VCASIAHAYVADREGGVRHGLLAKQSSEAAGRFGGFPNMAAQHGQRIGLMFCGRMQELGEVAREHARQARACADLVMSTSASIYVALATLATDEPKRALRAGAQRSKANLSQWAAELLSRLGSYRARQFPASSDTGFRRPGRATLAFGGGA